MKQIDQILNYMMKKGPITNRTAMLELDIGRLPSRISEMKALGIPVQSRRVSKCDEQGREIKHWEEYYLA